MVANLDIISKEMIKPSSPTPDPLRNLKLSFLDQIAPPIYIPLIFFYKADQLDTCKDHAQISQLLKRSLSNVLVQFYPLAGKIYSDQFSIDCTDAGALYVEARVHSDLSNVIENPIMEELKQCLPLEPNGRGSDAVAEAKTILLAVQMNLFDCGGIAIAVQMSHKIADGTSLVTFMKAWAASSRGAADTVSSDFDLESLFPTRDMSSFGYMRTTRIIKEKIVTKRFVFDKKKVAKLKEDGVSGPGSQVKDPTRVEAVSAFLWRHFIEASKGKMVAAAHAVNMRPRMNPALGDNAFGNIYTYTVANPMADGEKGYHNLVCELRNSIRSINCNYVKKLRSGDEYLKILENTAELVSKGDVELCKFSSWCRFPVYEVDFSWGKPTWVCTTTLPFKNLVILMSTSCGEGIEAWVNILEEAVPSFQGDHV
ncbi:hypothetical protein ACH5RR_001251 [Cinchona calisaya]|uniref:Vinorine synthase n=1 Tax=Cinchona calisaya TaxID=153742 RepID=A0ABD3B2W0_9GENT